jgi:DNA-binding IclR family transcriptional regulator
MAPGTHDGAGESKPSGSPREDMRRTVTPAKAKAKASSGSRRSSTPEAWYVARTMQALELLAFGPLSAPQLAAALDAHPRTARRLLTRLEHEGYLTRSQDARRLYTPTMRIVALASQVIDHAELPRFAVPYVSRLRALASADAHLVVPSYRSVVCLVHASADGSPAKPGLGELAPAHATAGGKILLGWRDSWRESVLATPLDRLTDRTVTDDTTLRREVAAARERGHATEWDESVVGLRAVAAPVLVDREAVAALAVSGDRLDVESVVPVVVGMASELSGDLADAA